MVLKRYQTIRKQNSHLFWVFFDNPGVKKETELLSRMFNKQFFSILAIENSKTEIYS